MEKQNKVVNKIKKVLDPNQDHNKLLDAKKNPNDECYTAMQDILNELAPWASLGKFKNKDIICPCDWDIVADENIYSIKIQYKDSDIDVDGNIVRKIDSIIYDLWSEAEEPVKIELREDEIDDFLRNKLTCNFVRTLTQNARRWGIKSITASGYNPANDKGIPFQKVNYSDYDICITNPPFSLYREFIKIMIEEEDRRAESDKPFNFIVLAPFLNRVNPSIGVPLMLKKAYLGWNTDTGNMNFYNPTADNDYKTKVVACDWIVSYPDAQEARNKADAKADIDFNLYKDDYPVMINMVMKDGTRAIKVPATAYPTNYNGWMFTSIQVLNTLNTDKYEWYGTEFGGYFNKQHPEQSPFLNKVSHDMYMINGKCVFAGIVFRKKSIIGD